MKNSFCGAAKGNFELYFFEARGDEFMRLCEAREIIWTGLLPFAQSDYVANMQMFAAVFVMLGQEHCEDGSI